LVGVVPVDERTEGVVLLERVAFAAKCHPSHLPAESVYHRITSALAVDVRVPAGHT
jgi:hypothetical protein